MHHMLHFSAYTAAATAHNRYLITAEVSVAMLLYLPCTDALVPGAAAIAQNFVPAILNKGC